MKQYFVRRINSTAGLSEFFIAVARDYSPDCKETLWVVFARWDSTAILRRERLFVCNPVEFEDYKSSIKDLKRVVIFGKILPIAQFSALFPSNVTGSVFAAMINSWLSFYECNPPKRKFTCKEMNCTVSLPGYKGGC